MTISSRLQENSITHKNTVGISPNGAGCSKRLSSKAAAKEEARHTRRYVEPLSDARTPPTDFFSILLEHSGEDEVGDTSEESRCRQCYHPSQDHVTHGRPAHGRPAFEQAYSDNG
jgi:hypothetical protein